uniref:hypothetical protein n=2 Tax=Klebsiella pneumoniae complex TaxID=3390273 RepID=UPI0022E3F12D
APSAKGDDKFITTDYLQQCQDCGVKNVRPWHKADVKTYSIGKLLDAASAAWRRQMRLHVSVESNGAESPA